MSDDIPYGIRQTLDKLHTDKTKKDFADLDIVQVARFSDKELAAWQFEHQPGTPQHIIADHEWQRRLTMQQARTAYRTAWIGVAGTLLGTALGTLIGWWLAK
jgi:hypothetical protein